ncbi:hypothetical protein H2200_006116 [Cladophialophora chaetospira]|uniref:DNA repair protein rhp42 n=1 Tax=Cladophialophora chaetospira TaxID=386627 RepID=A0AA38XAG2_9EURO|nr:hypothetical protein H2200_006116 [Cladophialophora chaetospira]
MPPFIPRKRPSASPPASSRANPPKRAKLTDVLDAESKNVPGLQRKKTFSIGGSDDSESSLSDVDSDQFENVPSVSRKVKGPALPAQGQPEDDDEDIEWEDAAGEGTGHKHDHHQNLPEYKPQSDGPIEVTLRKRDDEGENWLEQAAAKMKKGPSKRDKQVRICAHQLHVQFLLWHNAIRNRWVSDRELQHILVQQLPPPIMKEVETWRRASGLSVPDESEAKPAKGKRRGKQRAADPRRERDWGRPSQRLEKGKPDMSNGDPIITLMKILAAYWKKNFSIVAPGLRKLGYGTTRERKQIIQSQNQDGHDPEQHGERVCGIRDLHELARKREGSRDVGAQLFTALLRGLGIEARLVASLQPSGYGWTKSELTLSKTPGQVASTVIDSSSDESEEEEDVKSISEVTKASGRWKGRAKATATETETSTEADDSSIVEITPSRPRRHPQKYDRDHPFPIYWTEAISPITSKVIPISPLVLTTPVATGPETLANFEPRGAKAEKTKTIMAYVVAYSSDGTAKDVTVRYLKNQTWPGKTKGSRFPVEKIPIYNKHGKVKRYENFDWFKRVMSFYVRPDLMRTAVDDIEDTTELIPRQAEQKNADQDVDTLQSLKASAEYVLERFLRREEALRPDAVPVRTFTSGKGDNLKNEPVYLRRDVERCLTAESWHKEGRRPKAGEAPMKLVPVRAVTITRKREAEEHQRVTGEKQMQGLYSWDQTEYIIPPPIVDGKIPKNAYGNIDCFVPSMVPRGAVHIALRGTVRICKRLEIDFAEAVTGFEFGNKRAVPVCTGVVVAKEHERAVREAWREYNEAQRAKEEKKLEATILETWRKFVIGLRIRERVRDTYGEGAVDDLAVGRSVEQAIVVESEHEDLATENGEAVAEDEFGGAGGFLPETSDEEGHGSDLEIGFHPNDDRGVDAGLEQSVSHSKEMEGAAEAEYPTPSSVAPLAPAVRRQRLGNSTLVDEGAEISSLSSVHASNIGDSSDSDADSLDDENSSEDGDDESEEYEPARSKARHKRNTIPRKGRGATKSTPQSPPQPKRTTTRARKKPESPRPNAIDMDVEDEDQDSRTKSTPISKRRSKGTPKRATPQRRGLRRDSTVVTSPYFNG